MPSIINALSTGSGGLVQTADASGVLQLQTNNTTALTVDTAQKTTISNLSATTYTPATSLITSGTAVASTSGTSIDFTGIPSWVKRITVMFNGVSTNGTSHYLVQIGSGSVQTTSYAGAGSAIPGGTPNTVNSTTGFLIFNQEGATQANSGAVVLTLITANTWIASGVLAQDNNTRTFTTGGKTALSGTLDRVRITTVNGTDTFDAGSINILYE
jgi:hypothetical protein